MFLSGYSPAENVVLNITSCISLVLLQKPAGSSLEKGRLHKKTVSRSWIKYVLLGPADNMGKA